MPAATTPRKTSTRVPISSLPAMPKPAVYTRRGGATFLKLNENFHVKTKLSSNGKTWLGDGTAEKLNPDEMVTVVQQ